MCYHGYCSYAPLSDIVKHQNQCTIPSSSRICIQISFTYPALPNCHFQILPLYYNSVFGHQSTALLKCSWVYICSIIRYRPLTSGPS